VQDLLLLLQDLLMKHLEGGPRIRAVT